MQNMSLRLRISAASQNRLNSHSVLIFQSSSFSDRWALFIFPVQFADEEGVIHCWIIGKNGPEPEYYGFAEYLQPPDGVWTAGYVARTNNNEAPWLFKAWEELGFDFHPES